MNPAELQLFINALRLEPLVPEHATHLYPLSQSPDLYQYIPQNPPVSLEALEKKYAYWAKRAAPDGSEIWLNYAVFSTVLNAYVGTLQSTILSNKTAYIAYEIYPEHWRKGFAHTACSGLIEHLFQEFGVLKILAHVDTQNLASIGLLTRLGFEQIEFIPSADTFKGRVSDEFVYARFSPR